METGRLVEHNEEVFHASRHTARISIFRLRTVRSHGEIPQASELQQQDPMIVVLSRAAVKGKALDLCQELFLADGAQSDEEDAVL